MNRSSAIHAAATIRPKHRVWVSVNGKVISNDTPDVKPVTTHKAKWEAYVIEAVNGQEVTTYPHLTGNDTIAIEPSVAEQDVKRIYLDKCRFADHPVNVTDLSNKIEMAVLDIHVEIFTEEQAIEH